MALYGLSRWHDSDKAEVDIVFIHGLRGHRENTWSKYGCLWPKELLSKDIPHSRILSFGYDSAVVHSDTSEVTQGSLAHDATSLCSLLDDERNQTNTNDRPIIVVGHSLGGLVLAQVIYEGERDSESDSINRIAQKIKGAIFLGTPFGGSKLAGWAEVMRRLLDLSKKTDQNTLKNLVLDSEKLQYLRRGFPEVVRKRNFTPAKIAVVFFFEKKMTHKVLVVKEEDASYPGVGEILPIHANHHDICKFDDADDDGYKKVRAKIKQAMEATGTTEPNRGGNSYTVTNHGTITNFSQGDIRIESQNFNYS